MQSLTPAEEEVMLLIWKTNGGFIREFMEAMEAPPPYTTLASTVKNLEKKKFVRARKMANSYRYEPAVPQEAYHRQSLSQTVRNYFSDSYKDMVAFFAREQKISPEELKEIIRQIEEGK